MTFLLNDSLIRSLCDQTAWRKGEAACRAGKVELQPPRAAEGESIYAAAIRERGAVHRVQIRLQPGSRVTTTCSCSTEFAFAQACKHVAAALRQIMLVQRHETQAADSTVPADADARTGTQQAQPLIGGEPETLAARMLELFRAKGRSGGGRSQMELRAPLQAEFALRVDPLGPGRRLIGVELRIGPDKRYAVPELRAFLTAYARGEPYACSRHFTYLPAQHCFGPDEDRLIQQLCGVSRNERLQREAAGALYSGEVAQPSLLRLPPYAWETAAPLLAALPHVRLYSADREFDTLAIDNGPLPVRFAFAAGDERESCVLHMHGLRALLLLEAYDMALADNRFIRLAPGTLRQLEELQTLLRQAEHEALPIPYAQVGAYVEHVVPALMRLGDVQIARAIAQRIETLPLEARIYLDRVRERLLAAVEFQYGDLVMNPLEAEQTRDGERRRMFMRDGEREARILELMEGAGFTRTESGYVMQDEPREFHFLYHVVPHLEELAKLYATSAVKVRVIAKHPPPRIAVTRDERTNWLELRFELEGISDDDVKRVLDSLAEKRSYHRLSSGALLPLESEAFAELVRFLNDVGLPAPEEPAPRLRLPLAQGLSAVEDHERLMRLAPSMQELLQRLDEPQAIEHPLPPGLSGQLRPYQIRGYQWMKTLAQYGFGGILADEMGLGKTVQSIAFLASLLEDIRARRAPALIVCPASLLYNWRSELQRFAPEARTAIVDGPAAPRRALLRGAAEYEILITSYPLLRQDIRQHAEQPYHALILDEAQMIKNDSTQTARAVKRLRAEHRFALTGTPLENRLDELRSIFEAVFPGLFPERRIFAELSADKVRRRARPFLLRRLKRDVLQELPDKRETTLSAELLPAQKKLYAAYLARLRYETLKHLEEDDFGRSRIRFLAGLTRLRQLCCHPALFVEGYSGSSAKFEQLLALIDDCRAGGRRLLVFSQFTSMLELIARELGRRGVPFFALDGETPAARRLALCSRFNNGERDVFLISLKAGGTGLNLTGADTVVLYDLWWNPAVEQQAEDRAHRIGQTRAVQVIRLVARGTIEEKMLAMQQSKRKLLGSLLESEAEAAGAWSKQDIRALFRND
ncbi:DEAD/DEAH box helicase [Paenibacillus sp. IB182496]|uniref:DEAD/DEAH box helicase n=1 Tax=Paenibacillus sabuli TaxID=2772509 RepID=A0A927BTV0_9BACL|nr:DEAD/DEAH box helicase [Paenibacillus sabuli]MBD2846702.1 DEAD/DEAH box helicase [Paenibacillus sabuli]